MMIITMVRLGLKVNIRPNKRNKVMVTIVFIVVATSAPDTSLQCTDHGLNVNMKDNNRNKVKTKKASSNGGRSIRTEGCPRARRRTWPCSRAAAPRGSRRAVQCQARCGVRCVALACGGNTCAVVIEVDDTNTQTQKNHSVQ